ncbi:MAG TPA: ABC transporter substrate-binding protein [Polyangiaceae bacterium]|nr:ABC transporter substrate-binding protein [Polyangiaceae bacterium]
MRLWFSYGGKNRVVLEQLVRAFNESQGDVHVQAVFQGDYYEALAKLRVAMAARDAPALSHVVGEIVPYLCEAGVLARFDRHEMQYARDVLPALGQSGSFRGGAQKPLVALPFNRSTPIAYLNASMFREAALTPPRTWTELRETARSLTRSTAGRTTRYGFGCPIDWWFWAALVGQAGGELTAPDGSVTLGGEAGLAALELWRSLVVTDGSMKPPPGRDYNAWEQTNQDFLAGRVAMIWTSTAFLKYLEENANFEIWAAPLPMQARLSVPTGGTHWVLPASAPAEERAAAARFVDFMLSPSGAASFATNTGYIPVTNGAVRLLEAEGFFAKRPNWQVAMAQLAHAAPWPWSPRLFRIQREIVQPRLERAIFGGGAARALLDEARGLAREGT